MSVVSRLFVVPPLLLLQPSDWRAAQTSGKSPYERREGRKKREWTREEHREGETQQQGKRSRERSKQRREKAEAAARTSTIQTKPTHRHTNDTSHVHQIDSYNEMNALVTLGGYAANAAKCRKMPQLRDSLPARSECFTKSSFVSAQRSIVRGLERHSGSKRRSSCKHCHRRCACRMLALVLAGAVDSSCESPRQLRWLC